MSGHTEERPSEREGGQGWRVGAWAGSMGSERERGPVAQQSCKTIKEQYGGLLTAEQDAPSSVGLSDLSFGSRSG